MALFTTKTNPGAFGDRTVGIPLHRALIDP
jgi:hypothetical protein